MTKNEAKKIVNKPGYLSNIKDCIIFTYGDKTIKFKGPYSLEYFTNINHYDNGYIEVMAKYQHEEEPEEEYIDLQYIAKELYMDTDFLNEIKEVRLGYAI